MQFDTEVCLVNGMWFGTLLLIVNFMQFVKKMCLVNDTWFGTQVCVVNDT